MAQFFINNIEVLPDTISDIPDDIAANGQSASYEIKGLPPVIPAAPWQTRWVDNDGNLLFTGHRNGDTLKFSGTDYLITIKQVDRSIHLQERYIFGNFEGTLRGVIDALIVAAEATNWFPSVRYRIDPTALLQIVRVPITEGMVLRDAIKKALDISGTKADLKVLVDTGELEIFSIGFCDQAPIDILDPLLIQCDENNDLFDVTSDIGFPTCSEITVQGRMGQFAERTNEVINSRNEYLIHQAIDEQFAYGILKTADRVISVEIEIVVGCDYLTILTFAGDNTDTITTVPAEGSNIKNVRFFNIFGIDFQENNVYFADFSRVRIYKTSPSDNLLHIIAGSGIKFTPALISNNVYGVGGLAVNAKLHIPSGVAYDLDTGDMYYSEPNLDLIMKVDAATQNVNIFASHNNFRSSSIFCEFISDGSVRRDVYLALNQFIKIRNGELYISTNAGSVVGLNCDGLGGTVTETGYTYLIAISLTTDSYRIVAGNGLAGFGGEDIDALSSPFGLINSFDWDSQGNLFIREQGFSGIGFGSRVRRIDAITNKVTTYAGNATTQGNSGDGGRAVDAEIDFGYSVFIDKDTDLMYLLETSFGIIRTITPGSIPEDNIINYWAGNGFSVFPVPGSDGDYGDGGTKEDAYLVLLDMVKDYSTGDLYLSADNLIRTFPC